MPSERYVLDANVFLEYIFGRPLQHISRRLIERAIRKQIRLIVPSLLLDEVTEVLCGNLERSRDIQLHLQYLDHLARELAINIIVPNNRVRMRAIEIARCGNPKSGYPELTDSLYHALAILNDAVFVTNDIRHMRKVSQFGHIMKLADLAP